MAQVRSRGQSTACGTQSEILRQEKCTLRSGAYTLCRHGRDAQAALAESSSLEMLFVVLQHREDIEAGKLFPPVQEIQFDRERRANHVAAEFPDELDTCRCGSAGCEQVVAQQDVLPGLHGVLMNFQLVGAVFKLVRNRG